MVNQLNQALLNIINQVESAEIGHEFVKRLCDMICSQIIPAVHKNPEEASRLLCYTDRGFAEGLLTLVSQKQSSNV